MEELKIKVMFTEWCLGTKPSDPSVFGTYVGSLAPDGQTPLDEAEAAAQREESGTTIFHRDDENRPMLWDYQIKGFFKDACGGLRRATGTKSAELKAYKTVIDTCVFVVERKIPLMLPDGAATGVCERPLRAETAQGPRVSLCRSETVPAGTTFVITIKVLQHSLIPYIREWLDYGVLRGIGQWRNSGAGRFIWEEA